ncbi:Uncharacterised protein [Vibrio cholerae]|nr:Uncharacterised protein [Vibrio cholerae]
MTLSLLPSALACVILSCTAILLRHSKQRMGHFIKRSKLGAIVSKSLANLG